MSTPVNQLRLLELLADQALQGISIEEQAELRALLADSQLDADTYYRIAARIAVALTPAPREQLPAALRARILQSAQGLPQFQQSSGSSATVVPVPALPDRSRSWREGLAWFIAAVSLAGLLVSWTVLSLDPKPPGVVATKPLEQEPDLIRLPWTTTEDAAGKNAQGEVLWSNAAQAGQVQVSGLAKLDPTKAQYQFWIFDATRDDRYPISGGVFNIDDATGTATIPINPELRVVKPAMFAVTVEKPGGVVVSSRERLALLAKNEPQK